MRQIENLNARNELAEAYEAAMYAPRAYAFA